MILVDSNVIIDVLTEDAVWRDWSGAALSEAADRDEVAINPIIYAEIGSGFATIDQLDRCNPHEAFRNGSCYALSHRAGRGAMTNMPNLRLDIVSDTICPWCYVGKRHLEAALPELEAEGIVFDVTWRPFQLNPEMPASGVERVAYRTAKFGSWERSQALDRQVAGAGAGAGLVFRHDLMQRTPNTVASHVLVRLAHEAGGAAMQEAVVEALFVAYFTAGRDIGDRAVLAEIGVAAGLDRPAVLAALDDSARAAAVHEEERLARSLRLDGVPSVLVEGRFVFSGAHPAEAMVRALRAASRQLAPTRA